ncbi:MAG TPA: nucleotidyl transferase AbiEii/AbiGii toxin family protein [Candidatus Faecenecus gallistercoris]|uniref:Nucleotidyl transferase AbiEii/AbiGii toxin family protein n=1 Tax=Candidatus Faecenecus gallistercoris TaxID=2840793 RepID=A0A9D1CKJ0_9FIRM|nr:nucleotidyl transferase AbiEii/AbiGii toxin family protein [Bacillota bacterium]MDY4050600.1 nucleotidyl transferase AbiEii/AbiGii toxin family protein [Candidatus Faecenecus gallistercoris]HIQ65301.1 nucleotidyl transferase AbiEii/AbiGii toxin family protein [Candidatus Faecenecus gallistercoris]
MIKNRDSLKARASNLSKKTNIPNKYLIQNFMFEALLKRISKSKYKDKFIIKGGFLLSSIFGVNLRSTMDLDTTIKGLPLDRETITNVINEIIRIDVEDNVRLDIENIKDIREEELYSGFEVNLKAEFDGLKTNLMIDITTGDVITYEEIEFKYSTLFDNEIINIMTYNYETIIAEKFESIISRNIDNTRMKDYYDLYMFVHLKWDDINKDTLRKAIFNTSKARETLDYINNANKYIELISDDSRLKALWNSYQNNYEYVKDIKFVDVINAIKIINAMIVPISV